MALADDSWPLTAYLKYLLVNLHGSFIVERLEEELGYIVAAIIGKTSKTCHLLKPWCNGLLSKYEFMRATLL